MPPPSGPHRAGCELSVKFRPIEGAEMADRATAQHVNVALTRPTSGAGGGDLNSQPAVSMRVVSELWPGWHRLASSLRERAWTPIVFDHLVIAGAESVGESVGGIGTDHLRSDVQGCHASAFTRRGHEGGGPDWAQPGVSPRG